MPNLRVPSGAPLEKAETTSYTKDEVERRVKKTQHLPDSDKRKYKMDTTRHWNNAVKQVKESGQLTLSQVLPVIKNSKKSKKEEKTNNVVCN